MVRLVGTEDGQLRRELARIITARDGDMKTNPVYPLKKGRVPFVWFMEINYLFIPQEYVLDLLANLAASLFPSMLPKQFDFSI